MILFCGSQNVGHFVPEVAHVNDSEIIYTGTLNQVNTLEKYILDQAYTHIMIDLSKFHDMPDVICDEITRLQNVCNTPFIFFALGHSERSELVSRLIDKGFFYFVTDPRPAAAKEQLYTALNGFSTIKQPEEATSPSPSSDEAAEKEHHQQSIGITGCCGRIGTTTQALQICKYLQLLQHKVCFVELNGNDVNIWSQLLADTEITKEDESLGRLRYANLDMYSSAERIAEIRAMDYDYIVYDFGSAQSDTFNSIQFLEKDIRIVVGGISPSEMIAMQEIYKGIMADSVYYIFSFISDADKQSVLDMQLGLADKTVFAPWAPDPFVYTNKSTPVYDKIIGAAAVKTTAPKGFFRKMFRSGGSK